MEFEGLFNEQADELHSNRLMNENLQSDSSCIALGTKSIDNPPGSFSKIRAIQRSDPHISGTPDALRIGLYYTRDVRTSGPFGGDGQ